MKLRHLEVFSAIAESTSITEAAQKLYSSQPSLSMALKELETELEVILFQRRPNGVSLTPIGEVAYEYILRILEAVKEIQSLPADKLTSDDQSIKMAANFRAGNQLLVDVLLSLQRNESDIQCDFFNGVEKQSWEYVAENILNGKVDIAIIKLDDYEEANAMKTIKKKQLVFEELYKDPSYIVMRQDHPLTEKKLSLSELKKYRYIYERENLNDYFEKIYGAMYCIPETLMIESSVGIQNYLVNSDAFTVASKCELQNGGYYDNKKLYIANIESIQWTRIVGVLRQNRQLSTAEQKFFYELKKQVERINE